ncbi:MAG TPA: hypothetical protein VLB29_06635 [Nocardioidaceae bacterium]|nr:hypothetical protein [Nocardioidaceae bacterium]
MARRVYLHVGTMKAATSYLQALFDDNRDLLAEHGITWHTTRLSQHAVHDFQGSRMLPPRGEGSWKRLREEISGTTGDVLVSMELMARMPEREAKRLVKALDADELRVIVTARDLTRIVPSHWQETTQNRGTATWSEFVAGVCRGKPANPDLDLPFWKNHHLPSIVRTWSSVVGAGNVTVVTIPSTGSGAVWERFASVIGVPAQRAVEPSFGNAALGAASAELMRRLNNRVEGLEFEQYRRGFKVALAKHGLSRRADSEPRVSLAPTQHAWLREASAAMVGELEGLGVRVVGDLGDLVGPAEPGGAGHDPEDSTDAELLDAALDGLALLGERLADAQLTNDRLRQRARGRDEPRRRPLRPLWRRLG